MSLHETLLKIVELMKELNEKDARSYSFHYVAKELDKLRTDLERRES